MYINLWDTRADNALGRRRKGPWFEPRAVPRVAKPSRARRRRRLERAPHIPVVCGAMASHKAITRAGLWRGGQGVVAEPRVQSRVLAWYVVNIPPRDQDQQVPKHPSITPATPVMGGYQRHG